MAETPFDGLAAFADDNHAFAVGPPFKVCDATVPLHAYLRDPLAGVLVEDIDDTAAFAAASYEADPAPTAAELETFHASLLPLVPVHAADFFDFPGFEVPDVEIAAAAGEEDFGTILGGEEGGCEGGGADVEGLDEGVWRWGGGGNVVEEERRGGAGGEEEGVMGMEGEGCNGRLEGLGLVEFGLSGEGKRGSYRLGGPDVFGALHVNDLGAKFVFAS